MVPKVAGKGRSFKGAGLYYLHDKKAETSERVAFTHTVNLPTRDADKAIRLMAYTAMHQSEIKARAGGSTRGRKLADPVYCYSLSWAPGEEPSQEEMIESAKETLKVLGLTGHEALLIGHSDEPHKHIHVIVNRVNPETGIAAPLKMDHLKLSSWAEEFEKRQGQIRCEQRVENNALRRQGEFVKDKGSQKAAEFNRWRQDRVTRQSEKRIRETDRLTAKHTGERDQLQNRRDQLIAGQRERFREATRGDWRDLFTIQRQEQRRFDEAQRNAWTRMRFFLRTHGEEFRKAGKASRAEMLKGGFSALTGSKEQKARLENKQKDERIFFADKLNKRAAKLSESIRHKHEKNLADLRKRQDNEHHEMRMRQSEESKAQAKEITEGRDKHIFRQEQRGQERHDLAETKQGITQDKAPPRPQSLSEKFKRSGLKKETPTRSVSKGEQASDQRSKDSKAERAASFKEQASDVTERKDAGRKGKLADQFKKVQEQTADKKKRETKRNLFKENEEDIGHDVGRERSRTIKPPK